MSKEDRADKLIDLDEDFGIKRPHEFEVGDRFGKLTVVGFSKSRRGEPALACKCDCGNSSVVTTGELLNGHSKSCGCLRGERDYAIGSGELALRSLFYTLRGRAIKKSQAFEFNFDLFSSLIRSPCCYCGSPPAQKCNFKVDYRLSGHEDTPRRVDGALRNGIDRVDSSVWYTLSNSVPCCKYCNYAKRDLKLSDFIAWALKFGTINPASGKKFRSRMAAKDLYCVYVKSARARGIYFSLTFDEFLFLARKDCAYCGNHPSRDYHYIGRYFTCSGVDREDSTMGYTKENSRACCTRCNYAKRDRSVSEFKAWAAKLKAHIQEKVINGNFNLLLNN